MRRCSGVEGVEAADVAGAAGVDDRVPQDEVVLGVARDTRELPARPNRVARHRDLGQLERRGPGCRAGVDAAALAAVAHGVPRDGVRNPSQRPSLSKNSPPPSASNACRPEELPPYSPRFASTRCWAMMPGQGGDPPTAESRRPPGTPSRRSSEGVVRRSERCPWKEAAAEVVPHGMLVTGSTELPS